MPVYVGTAGAGSQVVAGLYVGSAHSGVQQVQAAYVGTAQGVRQFYALPPNQPVVPPLVASVSPSSVVGARSTFGRATTTTATASVSGGTAPYTYAWSATNSITADAPTASATTFGAIVNSANLSVQGVGMVVVTDAAGASTTVTVNVELDYTGPSGGGTGTQQ